MQQNRCNAEPAAKFTADRAAGAFCADMLSWRDAAHWMIDQLHADGKRCPHCGIEVSDETRLQRWYLAERIRCSSPGCGRFYTSLTNTELAGSTLDPREFFLLAALIGLGVSPEKIATCVAINKETVKRWQQRLQPLESASA